MKKNLMMLLYTLMLLLFSLYSYSLIDPNLTLVNHPLFEQFRNIMVQFGYYQRGWSAAAYFVLITLLFGFHFYFVKNQHKFSAVRLAILTGAVLLLSYPFLSHDFFNY